MLVQQLTGWTVDPSRSFQGTRMSGLQKEERMPQGLEQVTGSAVDGSRVTVTIASNQDNGLVSYATGSLVYHPATIAAKVGGVSRQARLDPDPAGPFRILFSDRTSQVDVPPAAAPAPPGQTPSFGAGAGNTQPFDLDQPDSMTVSITLGVASVMHLGLFNSNSIVMLKPLGDLLVGLGPSLGNSAAGVFVVALTGFVTPGPK